LGFSTTHTAGLQELYDVRAVNQLSGFREFARLLKPDALVSSYQQLLNAAPRRHERAKEYFVGHTGRSSNGAHTNRREEHLAIALWNWNREQGPLQYPANFDLDLVDYQLPLKSRQDDKGVGKVDLFGVLDGKRPCVIELKIQPLGKGKSDTPLRAYLEALAYCAVVEANIADIAADAVKGLGIDIQPVRPSLMLLAPDKYWYGYLNHPSAGDWWPVIRHIAKQLREKMTLESHFVVLRDARFDPGLDGQKPRMTGNPHLADLETLINRRH
jgi:hypothetical protein